MRTASTQTFFSGIFLLWIFSAASVRGQTGVYTLSGGTAALTSPSYNAALSDESGIYVTNSGTLTVTNLTITKTGTAANSANNYQQSSQYGNNAGLLTSTTSRVTITGGYISTNGGGANGIYATGTSVVVMTSGTIATQATFSHGVDATYQGTIILNNVTITTQGNSGSAGLSTDFGGGYVTGTNLTVTTAGSGSPPIYSTGTISVFNSVLTANGGYGGIIDGGNAILITSSTLTAKTAGIRIFRSAPGTTPANVTITGGLIISGSDALFVDGSSLATSGTFIVQGGATLSSSTGKILTVSNSSSAVFIADGETLTGALTTNSTSKITAMLQNHTTLNGGINTASTGTNNLTIDASSAWNATANSFLTSLTSAGLISGTGIVTSSTITLQSGTVSAVLAGTNGLTKNTSGTATISSASTYTGTTNVSAGTFILSGSLSGSTLFSIASGATLRDDGYLNTSGTTTVSTSAKLMGTGTLGAVVVSGTLAPGDSAGVITTGSLTLNSTAHLAIELGQTVAGSYDSVNVAGSVSLGGTLDVSLIGGFANHVGDKFYIVLNDGTDLFTGSFGNVSTVTGTTGTLTLGDGHQFLVNYADNADGGSVANDVSLTLTAVPEPGTWALLICGGIALAMRFFPKAKTHKPKTTQTMKHKSLITLIAAILALIGFANAQESKPKGPPPGGKGGPPQESDEMQKLLASFNLTKEQREKYDAARAQTGKEMREIHEGKINGTITQDEVLKRALASHKAFNAAVKTILTLEQYAKWEPLREADHHKIAQAHKERDEAKAKADAEKSEQPK